jgi:mono/diheme cytochrome c family protein
VIPQPDTPRHRGTGKFRSISVSQCLGVSFWVCVAAIVGAMSAPAAAQLGGRATRPAVVPPQGPVRQVIFKNCTSCHGIDDYAYNALDRAKWDALITTKHRGLDVPLPAQDRAILLDWLEVRFGPTTKPFPRAYVAPEVTTFFSDAEGEALLKRSCTSCHGIERVNSARFAPERWRVVTVDMRERGAKLEDEELERLVEWLGRTRGTNDNDRQ